jgi:hypothetical protein
MASCGSDEALGELGAANELRAAGVDAAGNADLVTLMARASYVASVQASAGPEYHLTLQARGTRAVGRCAAQRMRVAISDGELSVWPDDSGERGAIGLRWTELRRGPRRVSAATASRAVAVVGNRATLERSDGTEEWFVSGSLGIEHGMVLPYRPLASSPELAAPLRVELQVTSDEPLELRTNGAGTMVTLRGEAGAELRYTDLHVTDADGEVLPSRLAADGLRISLILDDRGARYPLRVDPLLWLFQQKLVASDGADGDRFGSAVSASGDTVLVGAPSGDGNVADSGAAYVLVRAAGAWTEQGKLTASDGAADDSFGSGVAIDGDLAVVGARSGDGNAADSGAAYVFARTASVWTEEHKLTASDGTADDWFGQSVSVSGATAIVGAHMAETAGPYAGTAYVFTRTASTWTEQQRLTATSPDVVDRFGSSVSLEGDTALIGAYGEDQNGAFSGAAYVFTRTASTWTELDKLTASDAGTADEFGYAASLSGDTALVGAHRRREGDFDPARGAAYVFVRNGAGWAEQQMLTASGASGDFYEFGSAVALAGDVAIVGASADDQLGTDAGVAYAFLRTASAWTEIQTLTADDGAEGDYFGWSVALSDDTVIVGAQGDNDQGDSSGSAYVLLGRRTDGDPCGADEECHSEQCVGGVCGHGGGAATGGAGGSSAGGAGPGGTTSSGGSGTGGGQAPSPSADDEDEGGCGCRLVASRSAHSTGFVVLLWGLVVSALACRRRGPAIHRRTGRRRRGRRTLRTTPAS